jgi:hypothetical protein
LFSILNDWPFQCNFSLFTNDPLRKGQQAFGVNENSNAPGLTAILDGRTDGQHLQYWPVSAKLCQRSQTSMDANLTEDIGKTTNFFVMKGPVNGTLPF